MTRIAVVGAGGIGSVFGGQLHAAGHEVLFCSRRHFSRLRIESGVAAMDTPVACVVDPDAVPLEWRSADWVFVAVKVHQTPRIRPWLERLVGPMTRVVSLQNGLDSVAALAAAECDVEVLDAVVYCGAEASSPGTVRHGGGLELVVRHGDTARALAQLFELSVATITPVADYDTIKWRKVMLNCAANGTTALTGRPLGVFARADATQLARSLLAECLPIARAYGAQLDDRDITRILDDLCRPEAAAVAPSMLQDRLARKPTEHDAIYGAVVRAAEARGLTAPLHLLVQRLVACGDP